MRKLLHLWMSEPFKNKLQAKSFRAILEKLGRISGFVPYEFSRKPGSLKDICKFKATEFRQFLLHTGPVVKKNILPAKQIENFLLLHCAVLI